MSGAELRDLNCNTLDYKATLFAPEIFCTAETHRTCLIKIGPHREESTKNFFLINTRKVAPNFYEWAL